MKRFLVLFVLLAVGTVALADRVPLVRDRLPWLSHMPQLPWRHAQTADAGDAASEGGRRRGGGGRRGARGGEGSPIPVLVGQARHADLPVTVDVLGTVQATNTVTVKSQVDGKLVEVDFKEGQEVKAGDVLARVDPRPFQAAYDQAVAKKAQDDATLANARIDLARYQKLAETQYGSHQQADTQKALVTQTEAIAQQDQAAIDSARTTLDYATVRSPLDGRTGLRLVDAGNVVHAADATGIVTVTQVKPIALVFSLPQQHLRQVNGAMARGVPKVEALDGGDGAVLDTGELRVVDNAVDQTTGTVKLKGSFPNDHLQLWPGQFVNVRLYVDTLTHVVVVPTPAVQRGPDGTYVYALAPDGATVAMRKVTVGRQTEADSVITAGLDVPATVVTTGFTRLTDGAKVAVSTATASTDPRAPGQPPPAGGPDAATAAGQAALPPGERGGAPSPAGQVEDHTRADPGGPTTAAGQPTGAPGVQPPGAADADEGHARMNRRGTGGARASGDGGNTPAR